VLALFGIPPAKLLHAVYGAIRSRALVILRRRVNPVWSDPLNDECPRLTYSAACCHSRTWVIAANQRVDLVRYLLADMSQYPTAKRPAVVIVVCDPASRNEFAARAQDWRAIFQVGFELWLPDEPPAVDHLVAFCDGLAVKGAVLLSPTEALLDCDAWYQESFAKAEANPGISGYWSPGNPDLDDNDRVPIAAWQRRYADVFGPVGSPDQLRQKPRNEAFGTISGFVQWAPITTERLPAILVQPRRFSLQNSLYRHKEALFSVAARLLLTSGLPRHKSYVEVEHCFFIPSAGYFLAGSIIDPFHSISRICLLHPQDRREIDLNQFWSRVPQPKLDHLYRQFYLPEPPRGFVAFVPVDTAVTSPPGSHLQLFEERATRRRSISVPVHQLDPGIDSLQRLLSSCAADKVRLKEFMSRQVARPVDVLWRKRRSCMLLSEQALGEMLRRYGDVPTRPSVSIVVPLFGRWDFMRYQLDAFSQDPSLRDIEWIYVVDDPKIGDDILSSADALHQLFGVPFTVVYPGENLGFSGASNLGAGAARSPLLLLMNSDVFPIESGWLKPMKEALTDDVAAVGARLLYEDHAIQHAGMAFEAFGPWQNQNIITHPGKGLPDSMPPHSDSQQLPAATAACLLIRLEDYKALGGLSERFAIGDFEDGDLCLRLGALGKSIITEQNARLYHLERQSIRTIGDAQWRETLTLYNCWLFNARSTQH